MTEDQKVDSVADHLTAFEVLTEEEQRQHLIVAHGIRVLASPAAHRSGQHKSLHDRFSRVGGAHGMLSNPEPPAAFTELMEAQIEKNVARVRQGGLNTVVFSGKDDISLIARVCIGVIEYTEDYRRLHGELTPRLGRMRFQAQQLHDTLKASHGSHLRSEHE